MVKDGEHQPQVEERGCQGETENGAEECFAEKLLDMGREHAKKKCPG
jgi:hypothetical protein